MPALNRVQLIGHLGKDPEITLYAHRQEGGPVQHRHFAALEKRRRDQGIHRMGKRGGLGQAGRSRPAVPQEGQPGLPGRASEDRQYEDKDKGETKYYTKVVALLMQFLDKKPPKNR